MTHVLGHVMRVPFPVNVVVLGESGGRGVNTQEQCKLAYRAYRVVHAISSSVCGEIGGEYSHTLGLGKWTDASVSRACGRLVAASNADPT